MADETKTQVVTEGATQEVAKQAEAQVAEEERFDSEYVRKLRAEAADYRKRLRELEGKVRAEEEAKMTEQVAFNKNVALIGGALAFFVFFAATSPTLTITGPLFTV